MSESWRTRSRVCRVVSTHSSTRVVIGPGGARERLQLDLQRRERLADIVVQVARETPALLLLHLEQAARKRAQPLFGHLELAVR